jgi:ribosome biogenesis GTPase
MRDKGCAVREAVEAGLLSPVRYERYLKLLKRAGTEEFSGG